MLQQIDRPDRKRLAANFGLLAYAIVFCLSVVGDGLAFERRTPAAGRLAAARSFSPNFGRNAGPAAHRSFPGVAGLTGIPPRGETRFVSDEVCTLHPTFWRRRSTRRRDGSGSSGSVHRIPRFRGGTTFHFRIDNGRPVSDVVRELEAENIGVGQPNYIYRLQ
jgi:hypothetical protein